MKRIRSTTTAIVVLTAALAVAPAVAAPDTAGERPDREARHAALVEELGLNAEQSQQLQAVREAAGEQRQSLREEGKASGDREQVRTQLEALRQTTDTQVRSILTDEQYTQLEAKRAERGPREARAGDRRGPRGERGDGGDRGDGARRGGPRH